MRVLIVDDEPLARERMREFLRDVPGAVLAGEAADGEEAVRMIRETQPDLVFLDVQMPEVDGFDVIRAIGPGRMPLTVFATAYDEFAVAAFEVNAVDYLLKPVEAERFHEAVARARARMAPAAHGDWPRILDGLLARRKERAEHTERFVVRSGPRYHFVEVGDVDWIGAAENYLELHVGERTFLLRGTMASAEASLDPRRFVRIHRGTIVNVARIAAVEPWKRTEFVLLLKDGQRLYSSRSYRQRVAALLR